jgi:hypothetical protein
MEQFHAEKRTPIVLLEGLICGTTATNCLALLERAFAGMLRPMYVPIRRTALTGMTINYGESLPKTTRVKTASLNSTRASAFKAAEDVGLVRMMRSDSFRIFAEAIVGAKLHPRPGLQVICYEAGGYSGPHNDHHPENPGFRNGFVDLHIMFSNEYVQSQHLIYEEDGYLSSCEEVAGAAGIAVYRLPFWHYTTPLLARRGHESDARRWLLLGTFGFDPPPKRLRYR